MNQQAIKDFFLAYPVLVECFETKCDGVLHHSEKEAKRWVERNANKDIVCHDNPAFAKETEEEVAGLTDVEKADKATALAEEIADINAEIDLHDSDEAIDLENADVKLHLAGLRTRREAKIAELEALQPIA